MKPGRHICTACNAIYEEPKEQVDDKKPAFDSLQSAVQIRRGRQGQVSALLLRISDC